MFWALLLQIYFSIEDTEDENFIQEKEEAKISV
jgi:hypothetical protein